MGLFDEQPSAVPSHGTEGGVGHRRRRPRFSRNGILKCDDRCWSNVGLLIRLLQLWQHECSRLTFGEAGRSLAGFESKNPFGFSRKPI
jgi:hypothetical protein